MNTPTSPDRPKTTRGFASMDLSRQREIASKGGEVVSQNREHMAAIGRAGGQARGRNLALRAETTPAQVPAHSGTAE